MNIKKMLDEMLRIEYAKVKGKKISYLENIK